MALDRDQVVKAAIDLVEEVGLDGLTLRRLAKQLGVQAPALYWHFKNKQELLDQMAEARWRAEVPKARPLGPGERWEDWLSERARAGRAALLGHRDGAKLAAATKPSPAMFAEIELQTESLCGVGFSAADALRGMFLLSNYVAGFVLEEQADRMRGDNHTGEPTQEQIDAWALGMTEFPLISEGIRQIGDPQGNSTFEYGLQVIIDGLRARLNATRSAAPRRS
jgi:TetR/AcrR family transcriptional regulator, tetracycline repressor protein